VTKGWLCNFNLIIMFTILTLVESKFNLTYVCVSFGFDLCTRYSFPHVLSSCIWNVCTLCTYILFPTSTLSTVMLSSTKFNLIVLAWRGSCCCDSFCVVCFCLILFCSSFVMMRSVRLTDEVQRHRNRYHSEDLL